MQLPSPHGVANKAQASNEDSQKKEDAFKTQLGKMLDNTYYEDSGDEEEVSSMSSFGNDEVQNYEESTTYDTACVPVSRSNREVATSARRNVRSTHTKTMKHKVFS